MIILKAILLLNYLVRILRNPPILFRINYMYYMLVKVRDGGIMHIYKIIRTLSVILIVQFILSFTLDKSVDGEL